MLIVAGLIVACRFGMEQVAGLKGLPGSPADRPVGRHAFDLAAVEAVLHNVITNRRGQQAAGCNLAA